MLYTFANKDITNNRLMVMVIMHCQKMLLVY